MALICFVSPGHPANNPRLVRNAGALTRAGHSVVVVSPRFDEVWAALEGQVLSKAAWRYVPVDYLHTAKGRFCWHWARFRRRLCFGLARWLPWAMLDDRALSYGFDELVRVARRQRADLYLGQQHPALAVVAAAVGGRPFAFDAEDLMGDQAAAEAPMARRIERRHLRRCALVATMSAAAADQFAAANALHCAPLVLHNVPALAESAGLKPPTDRPAKSLPSVYWFGQSIGAHSRADQVLRAMPLVQPKFKLVLRGSAQNAYVEGLRELAAQLGCAERLEILPVSRPDEMVKLAAEHDVLFGSQPGDTLFNQCAIGNKVMTGIAAGLAVLFTDTVGHRRLLAEHPGLGEGVQDQNVSDVAGLLNRWFGDRSPLRDIQEHNWSLGQRRLNWDTESARLVREVNRIVGG